MSDFLAGLIGGAALVAVIVVIASYAHLVHECTKDEAWRRIKLMRADKQRGEERG